MAKETFFKNLSGFKLKPCYGPEDIAHLDYKEDLGLPGRYPFTRGVHETMYRGRDWTIRQLGSLDSPSNANERILQLIQMGATGVSICFTPRLVRTCLNEITEVIQGPDNVMPALIKAVKAQITLGEIINLMKKVFGEYREQAIY